MAVNAPEEEQTNLVAALRDKVRRPSYFSPPKLTPSTDPAYRPSGTQPLHATRTSRDEASECQYVPERSRAYQAPCHGPYKLIENLRDLTRL